MMREPGLVMKIIYAKPSSNSLALPKPTKERQRLLATTSDDGGAARRRPRTLLLQYFCAEAEKSTKSNSQELVLPK